MICLNCGVQISDEDKFCGACGSPIAPGSVAANKKSGVGRFLLIIPVGIVVIAAIVMILIFNPLFKPDYKTPFKDMVKFVNSRNTDIEEYYKISAGSMGRYMYE